MSALNESAFDMCEACEGSGKIEWAYHANSPEPDGVRECGHCGGTGYIEREAAAVESFEEWNEAVGYNEETQWW